MSGKYDQNICLFRFSIIEVYNQPKFEFTFSISVVFQFPAIIKTGGLPLYRVTITVG